MDRRLLLFCQRCGEGFTVRVEELLAALLPGGFHLGGGDVPVGTAFHEHCSEVLAEFFNGGATKEPVAVIDLVNDKSRFEDDDVRDHWIVDGIGVFGDVEVFLNLSSSVGEEGPVGADTVAIFAGFGDGVGCDSDEAAISDFELAMELGEQFRLAAVFRTEASAAEKEI